MSEQEDDRVHERDHDERHGQRPRPGQDQLQVVREGVALRHRYQGVHGVVVGRPPVCNQCRWLV